MAARHQLGPLARSLQRRGLRPHRASRARSRPGRPPRPPSRPGTSSAWTTTSSPRPNSCSWPTGQTRTSPRSAHRTCPWSPTRAPGQRHHPGRPGHQL